MNIEKIKDTISIIFSFIRYSLAIIFSFIAVISFLFTLTFFIGMIGCYPYAFTGFCISFLAMIIAMIILCILNVEAGEMPALF